MSSTHLHFDAGVGRQKPENIVNRTAACPFCDRPRLEGILAERGNMFIITNKYPVLIDTFQTVLVETDDCEGELSRYPKRQLYDVIRFGMDYWLETESSGQFRSVIFYKNHGPLSGGTIRHPHMQIVGLRNIDYKAGVEEQHFEGLPIHAGTGFDFNLSTKPRVGFFEFNIRLDDIAHIDRFSDCVQIAAHYVLNRFTRSCNSYNLFFYHFNGRIYAKLMPRFIISPLYVGFAIPQVSDRLAEVVEDLRGHYFS